MLRCAWVAAMQKLRRSIWTVAGSLLPAYSVEKLDSFRAGTFLTILPSDVVTLLFRYGSGLEPVSRAFLGFGRLRLG
jgi:hypothetical protein